MPRIVELVTNVLDGNTFQTTLHLVTLNRVYVPPLTIPEGRIARQQLVSKIVNRWVSYEIIEEDYPKRCVAEVWLDKLNINDWMRDQGYSRKRDWPLGPEWTPWPPP